MSSRLPPLTWLRAFEAAARHLSFARAALELAVTPSAISQQVRLLEQHLGRPLFQRLPRGVRLTEAGEAYRPLVLRAFEELARGTDALFGRRGTEAVMLRTTASFQTYWLVPRLPDLFARMPELDLRLITSIWAPESFDPAVDLEVRYGDGDWPGQISHCLTRDRLLPLASPQWIEARGRLEAPSALLQDRLIEVVGFREGWQAWFEAQGLGPEVSRRPLARIEVDTLPTAFALAERGLGVALVRDWMAEHLISEGRLAALAFTPRARPLEVSERFYLVQPRGRRTNRRAQAVADWILSQAPGP